MKRTILAVLLGLGAIGGFASGFAHLRYGRAHAFSARCGPFADRAAVEERLARICAEAAVKAAAPAPAAPASTSPPGPTEIGPGGARPGD